jgi:aflatoxin B1 aldehyde reductase
MLPDSGSSYKQAKETLEFITKGPLSERAVKAIDEVWKTIEHEAPLDNYHR